MSLFLIITSDDTSWVVRAHSIEEAKSLVSKEIDEFTTVYFSDKIGIASSSGDPEIVCWGNSY